MSEGGRDPDTYPCVVTNAPHRWEMQSPENEHYGETQMCADCRTLRILPRGGKAPADITLHDLATGVVRRAERFGVSRATTPEANAIWDTVAKAAADCPIWARDGVAEAAKKEAERIMGRPPVSAAVSPDAACGISHPTAGGSSADISVSASKKCVACGRPMDDGRACPEDFPDGLHIGSAAGEEEK